MFNTPAVQQSQRADRQRGGRNDHLRRRPVALPADIAADSARTQVVLVGRQCCNFEGVGTGELDTATASPGNLEQSCDEVEAAFNLTDPYSSYLPLSNRGHRFVSLDRSPSSPKGPKALARPHSPLDRSMVLFQDVAQVLNRSQLASPPQRAFGFQLFNDWRVRRILIYIDHPWRWVVR